GCRNDSFYYANQGSAVVFTRNTANNGFDPGVVLYHPAPAISDYCGSSVAAGDVNQDGGADVVMGCRNDSFYYANQGSAVVFFASVDCGLRIYDGFEIIHIACEPIGVLISPLRIRKSTSTHGIILVSPADTENASRIRIRIDSITTMALRKF
ncbi:MAG: FG-GAP repeat protein, partial [Patescibacteria group bacterium]|nr:FG-GAP repeat protein [Patescibacteria group bacterium]